MKRNEVVLDGRLLKRSALRCTPAGIPAVDFVVGHSSLQFEAGGQRRVQCEITAVALGEAAVKVGALKTNRMVRVTGFLAQRSIGNRQLMLHATAAEQAAEDATDTEARRQQ